jgi:hypothetical protein
MSPKNFITASMASHRWRWSFLLALALFIPASQAESLSGVAGIERALGRERAGELAAAQAMYLQMKADPDFGVHATLGHGRVSRWLNQFDVSRLSYEAVLASPQATSGMREEALLGLAQMARQDYRLPEAKAYLDRIPASSPLQAQRLQEEALLQNTYRLRTAIEYGRVQSKLAAGDSESWAVSGSYHINARQTLQAGYAHNVLQTRSVQGQESPSLTFKGPAAEVRATASSGSGQPDEQRLRVAGSTQISQNWRASLGAQYARSTPFDSLSGFAGASVTPAKGWSLGGNWYRELSNGTSSDAWMINNSYETGGWLLQWFVSGSEKNPVLANALVVRKVLDAGPVLRGEVRSDPGGAGNAFGLVLEWPFGPHRAAGIYQETSSTRRQAISYTHAWPTGVNR